MTDHIGILRTAYEADAIEASGKTEEEFFDALSEEEVLSAVKQYYVKAAKGFFRIKREEITSLLAGNTITPDQYAEYAAKNQAALRILHGRDYPELTVGPVTISSDRDIIANEAARRGLGETVEELAAKMAANSFVLLNFGTSTSGSLKAVETAISAAESPEVVAATFSGAKIQAETEIGAFKSSLGLG